VIQYEYHIRPSGLIVPGPKRPTAIDLFCGCGGFSLGVMQAGFEVLAGADWDEWAAITYTYNLGSYPMEFHFIEDGDRDRLEKALQKEYKPDKNGMIKALTAGGGWIRGHPDVPPVRHFWLGDIRKLSGKDILDTLGLEPGDVDLVFGGPPCQGFSQAGKREVMDPRNSLVFDFARLVCEIQPRAVMMENVPGIVSMVTPEGIPVMDAFCRILEDGGFGSYESLKKSLLTTSGAGAALTQKRGRKKSRKKNHSNQFKQVSLA